VTDWDLFGVTAGPATSTPDGPNQYTLAVEFSLTGSDPLWLKGYRFWRPADLAITGPITARTWGAVSEAAVSGSDATFTLAGSGWQDTLLAVPVPLVLGTRYRAGCHFPNGQYPFTDAYWGGAGPGASGIIVGPLVGHEQSGATAGEQGSLWPGAVLAFPNNGSPTGANYWVTPIITNVDPAADFRQGAVSMSFPVDLDPPSGEKSTAGALAVVGAVALETVGDKAAAGAVAFSPVVSFSVVGTGSGHSPAPVSDVLCSAWATPADIPLAVREDLGLTDAQLLDPLMRASELLWALTGRRWYGTGCAEEVRLIPALGIHHDESWGLCGCWDLAPGVPFHHMDQPRAVRLPRRAAAVVSVTVDAVALASTSYRLARSGWLERLDGVWDVCGGTTVVVYSFGTPPPRGGRAGAAALAVELAKDLYRIKGCALPRRATSVTRQGVTIDLFDPLDFLEKGGVGIPAIDIWIKSVNPGNRSQAGTVWSPDLPSARHRKASL
jgi:hypothetical protein